MIEQIVKIEGLKLWTANQGAGLPVMLCNGGPGCCDYLSPVANMIDDLVHVYRWEQRGCGRSEAKPPYNLETCISDLEALRRSFGYNRWIIGGHSWGANLSLAYALACLNRVQGLIYLAGTGITEDWKPEYRRAKKQRGELLPEFDYPFNDEVNQWGNISWTEYLKKSALAKQIRALHIPTLIVHGEKDIRPNCAAKQVANLLPNVHFEVIKGAGHFIWLTHSDQLQNHLRTFIHGLIKDTVKTTHA